MVALRREVLRRPLGLEFTTEQLACEAADVHLGLFEGDQALACLILTPLDSAVMRMRQVAVREDRHRMGLGRQIVGASETWARENGFERMVLHAREAAVHFYLALGYQVEGPSFTEVGIPHRAMAKALGA